MLFARSSTLLALLLTLALLRPDSATAADPPPPVDPATLARIRDAVAAMPLEIDGKHIASSVSIGVASHPHDGNSLDSLVARADRAMYQAKQSGRNRVQQFLASSTAEK